jgi:hypothetical protein
MSTAWALVVMGIAGAGPVPDPVDAMRAAWSEIDSYCADFLMTLHSETGSVSSVGEQCWDRRGFVRTETQAASGTVLDIRTDRELWYRSPAQPKVLHVSASSSIPWSGGKIGQGMGELVNLVAEAPRVQRQTDVVVDGRLLWSFLVHHDGNTMAVVFADPRTQLPVALEVYRDEQPVMTMIYRHLSVDPFLPEDFFSIEPEAHEEVVEVVLRGGSSRAEMVRVLSEWRGP